MGDKTRVLYSGVVKYIALRVRNGGGIILYPAQCKLVIRIVWCCKKILFYAGMTLAEMIPSYLLAKTQAGLHHRVLER